MARTEDSSLRVVCDAGPILHLDELGCLDLLGDFRSAQVPTAVWAEVALHRPQALRPPLLLVDVVPPLPTHAAATLGTLALDAGERAALQLLVAQPGAALLTDDAAARLAAQILDRRVHGTIGVLLRSVRRGLRSPEAMLKLLRTIPERSSLHLKPSLLDEILKDAEQTWLGR
jgi:predicted nucleic acid-binding protein